MVSAYLLPPLPSRPTKVVAVPRYHPKRLRQSPTLPIIPVIRHERQRKRKLGCGLLPPIVVDSRLLAFRSRTRTRLNLVNTILPQK